MKTTSKVTLSLVTETWRAFRIACLQRGLSASKEITRFMQAQLQRWTNEESSP